ncbi:MAG: orotate phosphoribosyltransferase [Rhodospirillaceae bacterium]|jgi:orotate phosphoribosyltransferase|nr:orotate phosphoribosyltransferase [Rhodospirillaceae bacterium]
MRDETKTSEKKIIAGQTAKILLDIKAVNFRPQEPYILTSGWASPVYIDCRWVISFLQERREIIKLSAQLLQSSINMNQVDMLAGGETAGIPYSSWLSEELSKPMLYVRKKPKGFGRNSQIEGNARENSEVLLVEDLATDGGSKIMFVDALRNSGLVVNDIFVVFFYDAFPGAQESMAKAGVNLHFLANWWDVLNQAEKGSYFSDSDLVSVREFLKDPTGWSKENGGK